MKKLLSFIISCAVLSAVSVPVFAETNENASIPDVKSGYTYSITGKLVLEPSDLMQVIKGDEKYLAVVESADGAKVIECEETPDNMHELYNSGYRYCLIKGEKTYLEKHYYNGAYHIIAGPDNYSGEIKIIFDMNKKQIRDYKTDAVLQSIDTGTVYYFGPVTYDGVHYGYSETIYTGSEMIQPVSIKNGESIIKTPLPDNDLLYGDINNDSVIDISDLTELSLILLNDKQLSESNRELSDIDGDSEVTVADLARLKQFVSKVITSLR